MLLLPLHKNTTVRFHDAIRADVLDTLDRHQLLYASHNHVQSLIPANFPADLTTKNQK